MNVPVCYSCGGPVDDTVYCPKCGKLRDERSVSKVLVVVDLDGTIVDNSHRVPLITQDSPDWRAFYDNELVMQDGIIQFAGKGGATLIKTRLWGMAFNRIVYLTGREECCREGTTQWLRAQGLPCWEYLYMRGDREGGVSSAVKCAKLVYILGQYRPNRVIFIDDESQSTAPTLEESGLLDGISYLIHQAPDCWTLPVNRLLGFDVPEEITAIYRSAQPVGSGRPSNAWDTFVVENDIPKDLYELLYQYICAVESVSPLQLSGEAIAVLWDKLREELVEIGRDGVREKLNV